MTSETIYLWKKQCRTTVEDLLETCQDRAARSSLRQLLTDIFDLKIRAMRYLPKHSPVWQELLYMVAGLIAEYPCKIPDKALSFGASLRQLAEHPDINATGIERRLELLLQLDEVTALVHPLHTLIVQAKNTQKTKSSVAIDYATLLHHLSAWENAEKWVQLRWANDFWCPRQEKEIQETPLHL